MKFNILIIDDEKNIREGLSASLEMEGYNTVLAENGKVGLELFAKGHYSERYGRCRICSCTGQVQRTPSAGCDDQLQLYRHTPRQFTL